MHIHNIRSIYWDSFASMPVWMDARPLRLGGVCRMMFACAYVQCGCCHVCHTFRYRMGAYLVVLLLAVPVEGGRIETHFDLLMVCGPR